VGRTRVLLGRPLGGGPLARIWWVVLIRAAVAIGFGVAALIWPWHTSVALVGLFGAYALLDGSMDLLATARRGGLGRHWWLTLAGATSIAAGAFAFSRPREMALVLVAVLGAWLIVRGIIEVLAGLFADADAGAEGGEDRRDWRMVLSGVMSALFGAGVIAVPRVAALSLFWALGAWAILHGLLMVAFALRLRRLRRLSS
jgi:uncharacterized membrane protein HdeD (DUF308 family)